MSSWARAFLAVGRESAVMIVRLAPYMIAGAAIGAFLVRRGARWMPRRVQRGPGAGSLMVACLLGTASPLCTIGTLPILAGLIHHGLPVSAAVAFLGGSSMTNPQLFLLTSGTLGFPFALGQWAASVGAGLTLGFCGRLWERGGWPLHRPLPPGSHRDHTADSRRSYLEEFIRQLDRVVVYLVIGVILGAIINVYVPRDFVGRIAGGHPSLSVALAALLSAPFYVCGGGALPIMSALVEKGLPAGAALAFFVAGPATRIQSLAALGALVRTRFLVVYVLVVYGWALLMGHAANLWFASP